MALERCSKGHFFDEAKHTSCPHCPVDGLDIRTGNNPIGRSNQMYVCISGDDSISREQHAAIIAFEPREATFHLVPGVARGLVYLKDQPVFAPQTLQAYDEVTIGITKLLFIPFCGERFQWKKVEENTK